MIELFNQAIKYIENQEFLQAEKLLLSLNEDYTGTDDVNWTLAIVQIYLGRPKQAIHYLEQIINAEKYKVNSKIEEIKRVLPAYEVLYSRYNEALIHINSKQYDEAFALLEKLIQFQDVLPLEIYEAFVLLALSMGKLDAVNHLIKQAPPHILNMSSIKKNIKLSNYQKKVEKDISQLTNELKKNKKNKKSMLVWSAALIFSLLISVAVLLNDTEKTTDQSIVAKEMAEVNLLKEQTEKYEEQLEQLQSKLTKAETNLGNEVEVRKKNQELLTRANISLDQVAEDVSYEQYQIGYTNYQNGLYEQAIGAFEKSIEAVDTAYYSDDALYLMIEGKSRIQSTADIQSDIDQFLNSNENEFKNSPYVDDVLLKKALLQLEKKDPKSAKKTLDVIVKLFSKEWTGKQAKRLLKEIGEDK